MFKRVAHNGDATNSLVVAQCNEVTTQRILFARSNKANLRDLIAETGLA